MSEAEFHEQLEQNERDEMYSYPSAPLVQPGDKVRLIVGEKTWIGIYPDGPWEEQE